VARRDRRGLGLAHVDAPELTLRRQLPQPLHRVGPRTDMAVRDGRVGPDQDRAPDLLLIDQRQGAERAAEQLGHPEARHLVDGGGGVERARSDPTDQRAKGDEPGRIEVRGGAAIEADGIRPVVVDDPAKGRGEVVQHDVGGRVAAPQAVGQEAAGIGVELPQRPALRARVAPRDRMLAIGPDARHRAVSDVDDETAVGLADPAEGPFGHVPSR